MGNVFVDFGPRTVGSEEDFFVTVLFYYFRDSSVVGSAKNISGIEIYFFACYGIVDLVKIEQGAQMRQHQAVVAAQLVEKAQNARRGAFCVLGIYVVVACVSQSDESEGFSQTDNSDKSVGVDTLVLIVRVYLDSEKA